MYKAVIRRTCSEASYWSLTNISIDSVAGLDAGSNNETSPGPARPNSSSEVRFEDLGLSPLLKAVADSGYTTPTPIQARGIPYVLQGKDLIGIAQTGTGKTASFTLPMIEILARGRAKARMPRTLILEPTRELAAQVAESFERYGKYHKLSMALLIGGVSFDDQDKKLDSGVDVLIATPGRLLDHFERGKLMLSGVQVLVIAHRNPRSILRQLHNEIEHRPIHFADRGSLVIFAQRLNQSIVQCDPTQKLCVRFDSVMTSVDDRHHGRDHFVLPARKRKIRRHQHTKGRECVIQRVGDQAV